MELLTLLFAFLYACVARADTPTPASTSVVSAPTQGYCYYPGANPSAAENDRPCDPTAETSVCCPIGWTCMSNKICVVTDGTDAQAAVGSIRRGTCTNPAWNSTVCGDFCLNLPAYDLQGDLIPCGDNVFVCSADEQDNTANCAAKEKVFTLAVGTAQTVIGNPTGVTSTSIVPVSASGGSTLITSAASSSASSTATSSTTSTPNSGSKSHTGAIAGGVVGGIALIAIVGLIAWYCVRRRRRIRAVAARDSSPESFAKPSIPEAPVDPRPLTPEVVHAPYIPPAAEPLITTAEDDDRPRYDLYDDGETEIAGAGSSATAPVTRRPEDLEARDRELAGITGRAFVGGSRETVPSRDVPPSVDGPTYPYSDAPSIFGNPSRDMLGTDDGGPPGRVSPLHGARY